MRIRPALVTFLPLTPWIPRVGLRLAPELRAAGDREEPAVTASYSTDSSSWTGSGDVLAATGCEWRRFVVVVRADEDGAG